MKTIARVRLDAASVTAEPAAAWADPWPAVAALASGWARAEGAAWRDATVLVPFLELLPPARSAFAALGGWMPRIETTRTLSVSLGPPVDAGESGFDAALDTLVAMQLLAREKWGSDWSRRDRRGFERGAARVVATARELGRAAGAVAPADRPQWWSRARDRLRMAGGPGAKERLLAQIALEWAAAGPAPASDRLFGQHPSAWIVVEAGGPDRLAAAVVAASDAPALVIDTDALLDDPFSVIAATGRDAPAFALLAGFEDEAGAAAAQVLAHLGRGERPIALVAQDRALVRRIRALLERSGVRLGDETGWKLATTRAGATVMALLVAARPASTTDAFLDWFKAVPMGRDAQARALAAIESACRRAGVVRRDAIAALALDAAPARLYADAASILQALASPARRGLPAWLDALRTALDACGALEDLCADAAGLQALAALNVEPALASERRQALDGDLEPMTLADFTRWVDDVFERVAFRPPDAGDPLPALVPDDAADAVSKAMAPGPDVVVTPLARAMLRPFAALVLPGADSQRLGASPADDSLLPRDVAEALGLPGPSSCRDAELLAFVQALRLPRVTLMRRRGDPAEPLAESAFVERLRLALAGPQRALRPWLDPRTSRPIEARPVHAGSPSVPASALPSRLSASAFEALRACPYRFFSRSVLRLGEAEELDDEVEKRDYGSWLHAVLHAFHLERNETRTSAAQGSADAETARLLVLGEAGLAATGMDAAAFLPFHASFAAFAPRYIAWLQERERQGWSWASGETELSFALPGLDGIVLRGRIDRIDRNEAAGSDAPALELIDYKTGSAAGLKTQVAQPLEDTQLAFYAALVGSQTDAPLRASYLALDGTHGLEQIVHGDVEASASALLEGAADELGRLRQGAGLPPLGVGAVCDHCEARGLCRRDHWTVAPAVVMPDARAPGATLP